MTDVLDIELDDLDLSVRLTNRLKQLECQTVADIVKLTERDCLRVDGFGRRSLNELKARLAELGLALAQRRYDA